METMETIKMTLTGCSNGGGQCLSPQSLSPTGASRDGKSTPLSPGSKGPNQSPIRPPSRAAPRFWESKRPAIAGESSVAANVPVIPKDDKTKALIEKAIQSNLLFNDMPPAGLAVIIGSMQLRTSPPGCNIIKQGDIGAGASEFYVLEEGMCEVWLKKDPQNKDTASADKVLMYGAGSCFGELALLYSSPRQATVRAATACKMWVMERSVYNAVKRNFMADMYAIRHKLLDSVPSLKVLSPYSRALLVDALTQVEYKPYSYIFWRGDAGNDFYIIKEGAAIVKDGETVLARLGPGAFFGERALLGAEVRAADVMAETKLVCYKLSRDDFNQLLGSYDEVWRFDALQKVPILSNLSEHQLRRLSHAMQTKDYVKGSIVFREGDPGDNFYIIQQGEFSCYDDKNRELAWVGEGSCFGELALLRQDVRAANVIALTDARVLTLSRDQFTEQLGNLSQLQHVWRFEALRRVPLLVSLQNDVLLRMAEALVPVTVRKGQAVIKQGHIGDMFYIVEQGELGVFKMPVDHTKQQQPSPSLSLDYSPTSPSGTPMHSASSLSSAGCTDALILLPMTPPHGQATLVATFKLRTPDELEAAKLAALASSRAIKFYRPGDYFGELALMTNEPRAATVSALTDCRLLSLTRDHFSSLMGSLLPTLVKAASGYLRKGALKASNQVINLAAIHPICVLGSGAFGKVLLVQYGGGKMDEGEQLGPVVAALKCINKKHIIDKRLWEHVRREKECMFKCNSPFIVRLHGTAQDDDTIYMLMEAVMGGELFSYLQMRRVALSEAHARFYAASVILGLEYLHDKNCVYRDLKPENLLIDMDGYVKVTDFGFVKPLARGGKTHTVCGTPEYLAPEIIQNKGHNQSADWWSLGVLIYEFCYGMPPFSHPDRLSMFKRICSRDLTFPPHFSKSLKDLVDSLLNPVPLHRMGCGQQGAAQIKSHAWFNGFDWEAFKAKKMPAPYIPNSLGHATDAVNFQKQAPMTHLIRTQRDTDNGYFADF